MERFSRIGPIQRTRMPSPSPVLIATADHRLALLGQRIHARRKALKINAETIAEAAKISRMTLLRIERGVPSVTMGAYMNVLEALGLAIDLNTPAVPPLSVVPPERIGIVEAHLGDNKRVSSDRRGAMTTHPGTSR